MAEKRRGAHAHAHGDEVEPLPVQAQRQGIQGIQGIGAVAGGGIGGDQAILPADINQQVSDIEHIEIQRLIGAANARRDARADAAAHLQRLQNEQAAVVRDVRCLLPGEIGANARLQLEVTQSLMPLVDTFYDAFRPFLTEAYDDDATFGECFTLDGLDEQDRQLLRPGFELLMKESIVQGINQPEVAITAFTQLLFNNQPERMLVSAGGSIVAMILARDALRLFSSTVISVITFGNLSLDQLTKLCVFIYYNCSLLNLGNLLIYFNVPRDFAIVFITAIQNFIREQRQYFIMSIFLFGLNAIERVVIEDVEARINQIIQQARQYFPGVNPAAAGDNPENLDEVIRNLAENPQVAAQRLNEAAQAQRANDIAAAAQAQRVDNIAPPPPQGRPLIDIFGDEGIIAFINNTLRYGWMRGLRITTSCLRDVFHIYLQRPPQGQGIVFNLVNFTGRMARWGVAAIQDRSAVLDPAKPTQEVIRLLAAVNGLGIDTVRSQAQCEAALYEFGRKLKGIQVGPNNDATAGAVAILQGVNDDRTLVYLTEAAAPGVLGALRAYFRPGGVETVNVERLQNACLGMRLFVFEQGMRSNILASALVNPVNAGEQEGNFDDTQRAVQASESVHRMAVFLLEDNDTVTKNLFGRVRLMLQAFANFQGEQLQQIGVVINRVLPGEAPGVNAAQIFNRQRQAARLPHKEHMKSAVRASIIASGLGEEQKQTIIERLMESIDMMNFDDIHNYVLDQNPAPDVLGRLIASCQLLMQNARENIGADAAAVRAATEAATAAAYSGLGRCAASLMNVAVGCSGAVIDVARAGIGRVSGLFGGVFGQPAIDAGQAAAGMLNLPGNENAAVAAVAAVPGAAILANIQVAQRIDEVEHNLNVDVQQGNAIIPQGGRSRSRKRSASKRTRRNGVAKKQKSKKNKRQSRRYVRRASSRKSRK